jgi:osmotically-inducible protein OsmY
MKNYVGTLLCVISAAACSTNKPAENAEYAPVAASSDGTYADGQPMTPASSDGRMDGASTAATTDGSATSPRSDQNAPLTGSSPMDAKPSGATGSGTATAGTTASTGTTSPKASDAAPSTAPAPGTPPDNTEKNKRDKSDTALTPGDQGNNDRDLKITQQIRQAVVGDSALSFNAKNVKIITLNGKVTLRGPVASDQERASIEAAARKVAGAGNVDNQLEVKK